MTEQTPDETGFTPAQWRELWLREKAEREAKYPAGPCEEAPETENATVTVTYKGKTVVVTLDGTELSSTKNADGSLHRYFTTASSDFVSGEVEKALITLTKETT